MLVKAKEATEMNPLIMIYWMHILCNNSFIDILYSNQNKVKYTNMKHTSYWMKASHRVQNRV